MRPLLLFAAALAAPGETLRVGPVYMANFPDFEIVVETSATPGPGDLRLVEDGALGPVATRLRPFGETSQGVAVAVAIDASGSMRGRPIQAVREGLGGFVQRAREYDRIALATVADEARWEADWATPRAELRQRLEGMETRGRFTRLWDAAGAALTKLEEPGLPARRRLVLISDGHDESSQGSLEELTARAVKLRIPVDCIGISRSNPAYLQALAELSRATGGAYRVAKDTAELEEKTADGIEILLGTPVATFRAANLTADGQPHSVGVRWDPPGLVDQERVTLPLAAEPVPAAPAETFNWFLAIPVILLILLVFFLLLRRKKATRLPPPAAAPGPVALAKPLAQVPPAGPPAVVVPVPAPAPAAAPRRKSTQFAAPVAAALLRGIEGPAIGWEIPLEGPEFWLGAAAGNHCTLSMDETVSAHHACIRQEGGSLRLFDNQSTNGTWCDGERVNGTARLLGPGSRIRVGRSLFVVETNS